jgi:hypothetical protein
VLKWFTQIRTLFSVYIDKGEDRKAQVSQALEPTNPAKGKYKEVVITDKTHNQKREVPHTRTDHSRQQKPTKENNQSRQHMPCLLTTSFTPNGFPARSKRTLNELLLNSY